MFQIEIERWRWSLSPLIEGVSGMPDCFVIQQKARPILLPE